MVGVDALCEPGASYNPTTLAQLLELSGLGLVWDVVGLGGPIIVGELVVGVGV